MSDIVAPEVRSSMMAGIRGRDTRNELLIRKELHARGFRYLLYGKRLPGKPDLVFPKYRAVIMVNGCFWHGHDCHLFKWPSTRCDFWYDKIQANKKRDTETTNALERLGWRVLTVWECSIKGKTSNPIEENIDNIASWLVNGECSRHVTGKLSSAGGTGNG